MAKQLTLFEKLRRSFAQIDIELSLPDEGGYVSFKFNRKTYILGIQEEIDCFFFSDTVLGPGKKLSKKIFESALEITQSFFKGTVGEWDENMAYINSPYHSLQGRRTLTKTVLKKMLKEFMQAHAFMECNVYLMMGEEEII